MESYKTAVFILLFCLNAMSVNLAGAQEQKKLTLSYGDIVSVKVIDEPELTVNKYPISEWGTIEVPLLGSVDLKGKTAAEAETLITERFLADYLKQPEVEFTVNQYRPFFVVGAVQQPGSYPYVEGMTVQAAINTAGGFTENATRNAISLLTETSLTGPVQAGLNDDVLPGDVITIE
uniref:polysaccharide biosynthesis/export family protein n=1 Tax=Ningiella ruwaisensis TaxID=2364274 RepID=UPI0010A04098|nr:polysaccharide biosynthesis/export family protein [Ningiella ruwaisensis]